MKKLIEIFFICSTIGWITGISFGLLEISIILLQYRNNLLPAWRLGRMTLFFLFACSTGEPKLIKVPFYLDRYFMPNISDRLPLLINVTSIYATFGLVCAFLVALLIYLWIRLRKNVPLVLFFVPFILTVMVVGFFFISISVWFFLFVVPIHHETSTVYILIGFAIFAGSLLFAILLYGFLRKKMSHLVPYYSKKYHALKYKILILAVLGILLTTLGLSLPLFYSGQKKALVTPNTITVLPNKNNQLSDRPPNIVLISVDTLRADHLGCYGYKKFTSPNINRLAKSGVLFLNAYSQSSWTLPSHMTIFTSLYSHFHGLYDNARTLSHSIITLPEILKKIGYKNYAVVSWHNVRSEYGFARGFDEFDESGMDQRAGSVTQKAIAFLRSHKKTKPFFLFLHYFDPHTDYDPPPPFASMFDPGYDGSIKGNMKTINRIRYFGVPISEKDLNHLISLYDGEIAYCDEQIGILIDEFENLDISQETLFILTSDHGEEFLDHGGMGHRHSLYNEILHVPLIIKLDNFIPSGKVIKKSVRHLDIMPTILDLISNVQGGLIQGETLVPLMKDEENQCDLACFAEVIAGHQAKTSLIEGRTKIIHNMDRKLTNELYNLFSDPREQKDIRSAFHDLLESNKKSLFDLVLNSQVQIELLGKKRYKHFRLDDETIEKLKALGYIK